MTHDHTKFAILLMTFGLTGTSFAAEYRVKSVDTFVSSRGVQVPATFVMPVTHDEQPVPLVVMAHGHGGSRNETGVFGRVAESLARRGIASIRMDFPGCGDSTESFTRHNLTNMLFVNS